jgi:hypothetical protein
MQRLFGRLSAPLLGAPSSAPESLTPVATVQPPPPSRLTRSAAGLWSRWLNQSSPQILGEEKTQDVLVIGFCAAFSLIGWLMILQGYEQLQRAREIARWPAVTGTIIAVDVQEVDSREGARWRPQVTYAYAVEGRVVTATRITSGKAPNIVDEIEARDYARRFLPQSPVMVYYNPAQITESVLQPATPRSAYLNFALGAGLACLGPMLFVLMGIPASRRRRRLFS